METKLQQFMIGAAIFVGGFVLTFLLLSQLPIIKKLKFQAKQRRAQPQPEKPLCPKCGVQLRENNKIVFMQIGIFFIVSAIVIYLVNISERIESINRLMKFKVADPPNHIIASMLFGFVIIQIVFVVLMFPFFLFRNLKCDGCGIRHNSAILSDKSEMLHAWFTLIPSAFGAVAISTLYLKLSGHH